MRILAKLSDYQRGIYLTLVSIFLVFICFVSFSYRQKYYRQVNSLVESSIAVLVKQQQQADSDSSGQTVRYVAVPQLQQALFSGERGGRMWKSVVAKIEDTTSVRTRQLEIHGEITKVWEWLGTEFEET